MKGAGQEKMTHRVAREMPADTVRREVGNRRICGRGGTRAALTGWGRRKGKRVFQVSRNDPAGVFPGAGIVDDPVGTGGFFIGGKHRADSGIGLFRGISIPLHQPGSLEIFGKPDGPDLVAETVVVLFEEQRHIQHAQESAGDADFIDPFTGQGKQVRRHQLVQLFPGLGV